MSPRPHKIHSILTMAATPPPPAPPASEKGQVHFRVSQPWKWVMNLVVNREEMTEVENMADLPSSLLAAKLQANGSRSGNNSNMTPASRRRARMKKQKLPSTLQLDFCNAANDVLYGVHGTSQAFDGLDDKDELIRTMQRCRCDHLNLSPPSMLINWDATENECNNLIGDKLPKLPGTNTEYAVLKEPTGTSGKGIFFVKTVQEIHQIIEEHRKRAHEEPEFLDKLIAVKGRIPSWVLQAEVHPGLLIQGRRKFHIRSYVIAVEDASDPGSLKIFLFDRHEVRLASVPVSESDSGDRDRLAHITNGGLAASTERLLMDKIPELRNMPKQIELFLAQAFGKHFVPDMSRRVASSQDSCPVPVRRFALAGVDLMAAEDGRVYLLEVNVNPAAPPQETVGETFKEHLTGLLQDVMDLVTGKPSHNFTSAVSILERH